MDLYPQLQASSKKQFPTRLHNLDSVAPIPSLSNTTYFSNFKMGLFGKKEEPVPAQHAPVQTHHNNNRMSTQSTTSPRRSGGGFFSKRRSSSVSSSDVEAPHRSGTRSSGGLLSRRNHEDPSIAAARERVMAAERSEREADLALQQSRVAVREAREHVKRLELEAEAEAKAAKLKQGQAKALGNRSHHLGRM
ncbi:hypothetical protein PMZ80_009161 [Knufia obscura]|uniref:Uncharacterized protein n=1 Tax=Knufia obscura TaxID=1635080 RepID=A0ABR0REB9_9EURO|nr:hypothetical protein PMZ80_009161 [Knufia obscura]